MDGRTWKPTRRASPWRAAALVALGAVSIVVLAGVAGWLWLPRDAPAHRAEVDAAPASLAPDTPPPGLHSRDPNPESGLWCAFFNGATPICAEGLAACERQRGALLMASHPCERTTPVCFIARDRTGEARICTPTLDGCEQIRVGPLGRAGEVLTGCLPSAGDVVPDDRNLLVGTRPPEQWCSGRDCTGSEDRCAMLRAQLGRRAPCERRRLWCSGHAPDPLSGADCASSDRACEAARQRRVNAGRPDFGPCRLMP